MEYMTTSFATEPWVYAERGQRRSAHEVDAVVRHQAVRELREAARHPGVHGHVGQNARPRQESGLGGDEEQGPGGNQGQGDEDRADGEAADRPIAEDPLREDGVHRAIGYRSGADEEIADDDSSRGERERDGHVEHVRLAFATRGSRQEPGICWTRPRFLCMCRRPESRRAS